MSQLSIYGEALDSRLILGSARYPSPDIMRRSIKASSTSMVTLSLRRQQSNPEAGAYFWKIIESLDVKLLPNTAGCETVYEVEQLAEMSREIFKTDLIKLEVIGDNLTLQPDPIKTIEAAKLLTKKGFKVLPYCTDDLLLCSELVKVGCEVIMPWAAPIGTGRGILNPYQFEVLRKRLPDTTIIVDAGLGKPSHATQAMELGADAVLLNTAVAQSQDPVSMAEAFKYAVMAGQLAYASGPILEKNIAQASTPILGMPFREAAHV